MVFEFLLSCLQNQTSLGKAQGMHNKQPAGKASLAWGEGAILILNQTNRTTRHRKRWGRVQQHSGKESTMVKVVMAARALVVYKARRVYKKALKEENQNNTIDH